MTYQLYDNGASIRIVSEVGETLLMKQQVVQVVVIGGTTIKIDMVDAISAIYLDWTKVTIPVTANAVALRDLLNGYITSCMCGSSSVQAKNGNAIENGAVVLGNKPGDTTAILLDDREIPMDGHAISFSSGPNNNTKISGSMVSINGDYQFGYGTPASLAMSDGFGGGTTISRQNGGLYITTGSFFAPLVFFDDGTIAYGGSHIATKGLNLTTPYADFSCNTTATFLRPVVPNARNGNGGGTLTGNLIYTNEGATGAITLNLDCTSIGSFFTYYVRENFPLNIRCMPLWTIRVGTNITRDGGMITSNQAGSAITLCLMADREWAAVSMIGAWAIAP